MAAEQHPNVTLRDPFSNSAAVSQASSIVDRPESPGIFRTFQRTATTFSRNSGGQAPSGKVFKSYQLSGEREKPWIGDKRMRAWKKGNYVIWGFVVLGLCLSGYINYTALKKVSNHPYCLVLDEKFQTLNTDVWSHEIQVGGYGPGTFDWTTSSDKNTYTDKEGLHIVPTLTSDAGFTDAQILNGYTLNLTKAGGDGTCTGTSNDQCAVRSNSSTGTILPPVQSARLTTKGKKSIKYGRIEVTAKLPVGDWLWPAIWLMPEVDTYGPWPASGEIDIMESRGNNNSYPKGGRDTYASTLHWGPTVDQNAYWRTTRGRAVRRTDFSKAFHTFGIEWSEKYIFTYIDSRLQQVIYVAFDDNDPLWNKGGFSSVIVNSTHMDNPWAKTGKGNTPFDQKFYLILNVAVGSRNGWFLDNVGGKPWVDAAFSAAEFYQAKDAWLPTWGKGPDRGMTVKSVQMWQEGTC